ncbi:MAG TPA: hypothetical protein VIM19_05365 [Actinomycetes bacterium]
MLMARRVLGTALLLALAGVTAALSWLALQPRPAPAETLKASVTAEPSAVVVPSVAAATASSPASLAAAAAGPAEPAAPLSLGAGLAVRAVAGSCASGGGSVAVSTDAGATWRTVTLPVTSVQRVNVVDASHLWVVGAGPGCVSALYRSADAGRSWTGAQSATSTWHREAAAGVREVHTPNGTVALPCPATATLVDLAGISTTDALLLCSDGTLKRSTDGGSRWVTRGSVPGAVALSAVTTSSVAVAVDGSEACTGVAVERSVDGGATFQQAGCVQDAGDGSPVGLAFATDTVGMLWDSTSVWVTADSGGSWVPAS